MAEKVGLGAQIDPAVGGCGLLLVSQCGRERNEERVSQLRLHEGKITSMSCFRGETSHQRHGMSLFQIGIRVAYSVVKRTASTDLAPLDVGTMTHRVNNLVIWEEASQLFDA